MISKSELELMKFILAIFMLIQFGCQTLGKKEDTSGREKLSGREELVSKLFSYSITICNHINCFSRYDFMRRRCTNYVSRIGKITNQTLAH